MFEFFNIINYLILLVISTMGVLVILNGWKSINNRLFFFVILASVGWIFTLGTAWFNIEKQNWDIALFLMRFAYAFSILGTFLMGVFIYYFPNRNIKALKSLAFIYIILNLSLFFVAALTPLVNKNLIVSHGQYLRDGFGPFHLLYVFVMLLNLLVAIYFSVKKYYKSIGIDRRKMVFVLSGYLSFVTLAIATNVVLPLFDVFILQGKSQLLIIFFIVPAFFAIYKYRFFNFSYFTFNLFRNFVIYTFYLLLTVLFINLFEFGDIELNAAISHPISALMALFIFDWVRSKLPTFLTGDIRKMRTALIQLKEKAMNVETYESLQVLLENAFIGKLHFDRVGIFVIRKSVDIGMPVYMPNRFTQLLKKYKKDLVIRSELAYRKMGEQSRYVLSHAMEELDADLCLPLFSEGSLIAFVVMKKGGGDRSFSSQEINEIMSCQKDLSVSLMNILLKMNLQEENNLMKSIIDKKTKELKNKVKEINEIIKQQSDFIAVTAHEFRTPLSIASFQLEELLNGEGDLNKQREEIKVVDYTINNLKQLTERLFAIQQYDLNKVTLNPQSVSIKRFVKKIFSEFRPIMAEKSIHFTLNDEVKGRTMIEIDEVQMRQVLHNLLRNAAKFTPSKGSVEIYMSVDGNHLFVHIQDSGEGIPDELKESIFEKFRTKSAGAGIGLGLYLCKKIVELHGGKLWVKDAKQGGADFVIQLHLETPKKN